MTILALLLALLQPIWSYGYRLIAFPLLRLSLFFQLFSWLVHKPRSRGYSLRLSPPALCRQATKPDWVRDEVIRLAALSGTGCRSIANIFNRLHAVRRSMTVSKSYVNYTMRTHRYAIEVLRRNIKHQLPQPVPNNHTWAIDMTGKGDTQNDIHCILGIVDHGSRALLMLERLKEANA